MQKYLYLLSEKLKISTYAKLHPLYYRTVWSYCQKGLLPFEEIIKSLK